MHRPYFLMLALIPLMLAVAPAPAGIERQGCGLPFPIGDEELRASFERFDRNQSAAAAKICALYLNNGDAAPASD